MKIDRMALQALLRYIDKINRTDLRKIDLSEVLGEDLSQEEKEGIVVFYGDMRNFDILTEIILQEKVMELIEK